MPAKRTDEHLRQRILDEAAKEFARVGYRAAGLRTICGRADVNVAMVTYYFGSKAGLYREVVRAAHDRLAAAAVAQGLAPTTPGRGPGPSPREMLRSWVKLTITMVLRKGSDEKLFSRITLHELSNPSPVLADIVRALGRPMCDQLVGILCAAMHCGPGDPRVAIAVPMVLGLCMNYEHAQPLLERLGFPVPADEAGRAALAERVADFVEAGVLDLAFGGRGTGI